MSLTFLGEQFRVEVSRSFSLLTLRKGRKPIEMMKFSLDRPDLRRINNFMVKLKNSMVVQTPDWLAPELSAFIETCMASAHENGLPVRNRYAYLTVDTKSLEAGQTLRNPGWHLDGLQGAEVPFKLPACYEFIMTSGIPLEYTSQGFEVGNLNFFEHNIFDSLGKQVFDDSVAMTECGTVYLMNAYQMYRAVPAETQTTGLYLRLHFSELPITSKTMTINEAIQYPYAVHSSEGKIPQGLVTWEPDL